MNTRKTEVMKIKITDTSQVDIEGDSLEEVENVLYLCYEMRKDDYIRNEVGIRLCKAGASTRSM